MEPSINVAHNNDLT